MASPKKKRILRALGLPGVRASGPLEEAKPEVAPAPAPEPVKAEPVKPAPKAVVKPKQKVKTKAVAKPRRKKKD